MTMTIAETSAPPSPHRLVRIALIALGAILTMHALADLPNVFHDYGPTTSLGILGQQLTHARIVIVPFIAGAALVLATVGRLRPAIMAFATIILVGWVEELPPTLLHGFTFAASVPGLLVFAEQFLYPLVAIAAMVLAARDTRLALATALVAMPSVLGFLGVAMFAIAVAIHGF